MQTLKLRWQHFVYTTSGRITLALILFMIGICTAFLIYTYKSSIQYFENTEFAKLSGIAKSLAVQIDGDAHESILNSWESGHFGSQDADSSYHAAMRLMLKEVKERNELPTDVYTLVRNPVTGQFQFGISSAEVPYVLHEWSHATAQHHSLYEQGGQVGPYEDEFGTWLSSFSPIHNKEGKVVALVQVDEPFDRFAERAISQLRDRFITILLCMAAFIALMMHVFKKILRKVNHIRTLLVQQRNEIRFKSEELMSSINRAKIIQDAITPDMEELRRIFPEMFVMFQPRDVVSGDFYWFTQKGCCAYFAVVDCTGHGVPGGFMSMIGHTLLNDVVHYMDASEPKDILAMLDKQLTAKLYKGCKSSSDGMDIALVRYDMEQKVLDFAGAMRPLFKVSGGELTKIKGDRITIGGYAGQSKTFTQTRVEVAPGDRLYMLTDGFADQFGGAESKKYLSRKLENFLSFVQEHAMEDQQYLLQYEFHHWSDGAEQVDDVLVAGFAIP